MAEHRARIVVVDDTPEHLRMLQGVLRARGYEVYPYTSAHVALRAMETDAPSLVLLDLHMPELDGVEACRRLRMRPHLREIPVLFIVTQTDLAERDVLFREGGVDFLVKPLQEAEVLARVALHLGIRKYESHLKQLVEDQVRTVSQAQLSTIFALSKLAESRDDETGRHIERVQRYCRRLSEHLGSAMGLPYIDEEFIANITYASPLHDIGKVGIPDCILQKPGKLTPGEFAQMERHTLIGANTLNDVRQRYRNNLFISMGVVIARWHHERWDGTGYPDAIHGEAIPLAARIMSVADVYDALRARRCYKDPFPHEKCVAIIREGNGSQFDPLVTDAFLALEEEFDFIRTTSEEEEARARAAAEDA